MNWFKGRKLVDILQTNSSKVVDENGEPMLVYRGQDWSEDENGKMTSGLFVSLDRDFAEGYGEVMPLFVRSINPFNGEKDAESLRPFVEENFDAITKEYDEFFDEGEGYEDSESLMNALKENWWIAYEQSDILRNEIIKRGYDSIYIREDADNIWLSAPNQVKSATANNGDFSSDNPDIRFSITPATQLRKKGLAESLTEEQIADMANSAYMLMDTETRRGIAMATTMSGMDASIVEALLRKAVTMVDANDEDITSDTGAAGFSIKSAYIRGLCLRKRLPRKNSQNSRW